MISGEDIYYIVAATVPLYVSMVLAYISLKWLKIFTPEQCAGINKFVAKFSIPLLSFNVISNANPYKMNMKLIFADFIQKILAAVVLAVISKFSSKGGLKWLITLFSLSTLPNTLILGIPVLKAMYGEESASLLAQVILLQSLIWYNLLLFLFELHAVKAAADIAPSVVTEGQEAPQDTEVKVEGEEESQTRSPRPRKVGKMFIFLTLGKKLITNPNTHATLVGLIWACIKYKLGLKLPQIISRSISLLADGGLGMALFSLGLFMASQPSIIACGIKMTFVGMVLRFIASPALILVPSLALGLKGNVFKLAIVQAALPQAIVPFVFAKEYNVHPEVLSTAVSFGMLIALPVALVYYLLLAL
ncbi:hypothetical protein SLEP1_g20276 [Rubroshorea leprosula]|uniref:Auxin efflux carrier component n=1 Tax=Rubroshorea leprosula TaxID=152421 RepID=A0AAV5J254_9ROSI|nr:hypothetical protein SLEP1_g20276 [Rubroshorea leprosula]